MNVETLTGRFLVDTNVLIYGTLEADSRHPAARAVLAQRHREGIELVVSTQNLAEMYPNLTGPKTHPPDSPAVARRKVDSVARLAGITIVSVTPRVIARALALCAQYDMRRQRYFDMQLVATMQLETVGSILTENIRDFEKVEWIQAINPFA